MPAPAKSVGVLALALPLLAASAALGAAVASDVPQLWRVEAAEAPQSPVFICANKPLVAGFLQALPEINGQPCAILEAPKQDGTHFIARCRTTDTMAVATSQIEGDQTKAFSVITHVATRPADTTKAEPRGEFEQRRNYRALGACPSGWTVGDSAAAGATTVTNATNGASR
ncbi:MAG TPA: hypothetical protein VG939_00875, partial [Caulobacteraceae bacterium]|nr:hypothetical protein [Caulobacteraceae bacterium]